MSWGKAMGTYFLWYGTGRAYLETLRLDPTEFHFLGEKINTDVAAAAAIFGLVILIVQSVRHRGEPAPAGFLPGREPASTAQTEKDKSTDARVTARVGTAAPSSTVTVDVT